MLKLGAANVNKRVDLAPGVYVNVRPATRAEMHIAAIKTTALVTAARIGAEAMTQLCEACGVAEPDEDRTDELLEALAYRVSMIELAVLCIEDWHGIGDADGNPVPPTREWIALLLRELDASSKIDAAINARIHLEVDEGNGSPASPNGAAAAGENTAPTAGLPASAAPVVIQ